MPARCEISTATPPTTSRPSGRAGTEVAGPTLDEVIEPGLKLLIDSSVVLGYT